MDLKTPAAFKLRQATCKRLQFSPNCPPFPKNSDLIYILKSYSGKVFLEVVIGHSLFTIELKKYKFIQQLQKVGVSRACDLAIARHDYEKRVLVLYKLN